MRERTKLSGDIRLSVYEWNESPVSDRNPNRVDSSFRDSFEVAVERKRSEPKATSDEVDASWRNVLFRDVCKARTYINYAPSLSDLSSDAYRSSNGT